MTMICPLCGAPIHSETNPTCYNCLRIDQEQKRFGQRRPYKPQTPSLPSRPTRLPGEKERAETAVAAESINREKQREAFNQLLIDLYRFPRYLSDILRDGGFTSQQIIQLKREYLPQYFDALLVEIFAFWQKKLLWQEYEMLRTKYALDGKKLPMKSALMKQFDFSWQQIDKYREQGLHRLSYDSQLQHFEKLVVKTARTILKADRDERNNRN